MKVFAVVLVWFTACLHVAIAGGSADQSPLPLPERGICAHRGAMSTHPENTLPAFLEAIHVGVHMIEFDVCLSKDGQLVILHDATVDRTTDDTGNVSELTLAEIKKLDAGIKKGKEFEGIRIPTFTETLSIMPDNVWLNVHLKGGKELGAKTAEIIVKEKRLHQAFLACGSETARGARRIHPDIMICNMDRQSDSMDYANATIESGAQFIQLLGKGEVSKEALSKLKQHGIRINYYVADTPDMVRDLLKAGVDFPLVNNPGLMMKAAVEMGIPPLQPVFRLETN